MKTFITMGTDVVDAATVTVPNDRTFRDAWQLGGSVIDIDMAAAKEIHRNHIRAERMALFDPFDKVATPLSRKAAYGTALSQAEKDALAAAEAGAQKLRDAPNHARINAATTPDALQTLTLATLTA